jgi:hypothetical protein
MDGTHKRVGAAPTGVTDVRPQASMAFTRGPPHHTSCRTDPIPHRPNGRRDGSGRRGSRFGFQSTKEPRPEPQRREPHSQGQPPPHSLQPRLPKHPIGSSGVPKHPQTLKRLAVLQVGGLALWLLQDTTDEPPQSAQESFGYSVWSH